MKRFASLWLGRALAFSRHPDLLAIAACILIPNAIFLMSLVADIDLPPRSLSIWLHVLPLVLLRLAGRAMAIAAYPAVLAFDLIWTVAVFFRLSPLNVIDALRFAADLRLLASPVYIGLMFAVSACAVATVTLIFRHAARMREARLVPLLAAAALLTLLDTQQARTSGYGAGGALAADAPAVSATSVSGFADAVLGSPRTTALLVVVEALGQFADQDLHDLVVAPLHRASVRQAYTLTQGAVPFHGSTTAAEIRELCGSLLPYEALTPDRAPGCLPQRLAAQGRASVSIHGFGSAMFDRTRWYPTLGFARSLFEEDLVGLSPHRCGSVFVGICDTDIGRALPEIAAQALDGGLIYWLTLNTHVPIGPADAAPRFDCDAQGGRFRNVEVCRMAELWVSLMETIADLASDPRLGNPDILIVGDHSPPLWSRVGRGLFAPGLVPWVRLSPSN